MSQLLEAVRRQSMTEAGQVQEVLGSVQSGQLPVLLRLIKGMNLDRLGRVAEANELLLGLYEDETAYLPYSEIVNEFRIRRANELADRRLRILTNIRGGRIGASLLANADTVVFQSGAGLARPQSDLITHRLDEDSFAAVLAQLPAGWKPDYVLLYLVETHSLPRGLEACPYPVVGVAGDPWKANKLRVDIQFFDAFAPAMEHLVPIYSRLGTARVFYSSCAGTQGHNPSISKNLQHEEENRDYDVLFTGNFFSPFYRKRAQYLWRMLKLSDRHRILVGFLESRYDPYLLMARAKIVVHCPSIQGGVNLRPFEAIAAGALLFHEEGDRAIEEFFEPDREIVLFNETNFEERLEYYLVHAEERQRMAARAAARNAGNNLKLLMRKVIEAMDGSRIGVSRRAIAAAADDEKWNALGISDFYASNFEYAARCFEKAIACNGNKHGKYCNNLAVCRMVQALLTGETFPDIASNLVDANRPDCRTPVSGFNLMCYQRFFELDSEAFFRQANNLVHDLSSRPPSLPRYEGDELIFYVENLNNNPFGESVVFQMDLEFALLRFPDRGSEYQDLIDRTLLWRTLEYMGDAYVEQQEPGGAFAAYRSALKYQPDNEAILHKLAKICICFGMFFESEKYLHRLLSLSPFHERAHLDLTRVERELGKENAIRERLGRLLQVDGLKEREAFESLFAQSPASRDEDSSTSSTPAARESGQELARE